ncbi:MAG: type II toxin-antitoxin system RelE/ParE family toxin [Terriglobales bacterium]
MSKYISSALPDERGRRPDSLEQVFENAEVILHDLGRDRLEALKGDRAGQHSIRVNDQWRACFRWTAGGAEDVEIVDYH